MKLWYILVLQTRRKIFFFFVSYHSIFVLDVLRNIIGQNNTIVSLWTLDSHISHLVYNHIGSSLSTTMVAVDNSRWKNSFWHLHVMVSDGKCHKIKHLNKFLITFFSNQRPLIIFYNYFNAIFIGPGFVPKNWRPVNTLNLFLNQVQKRVRIYLNYFILSWFFSKH